jgi:hypothetical protein
MEQIAVGSRSSAWTECAERFAENGIDVSVLPYMNIPVTKKPVIRSPGDPFERLRAGHCDEPPVKENRRLMLIREEQAAVRPWGQYPIGGVDAGL